MNVIEQAAESIIKNSFAIIQTPKHIYDLFEQVEDGYASLPPGTKTSFRFDDRADGFLPQGQEYAENSPDKPDLCERFCYWYRHRHEHRMHDIRSTQFYRGVSRYEAEIADLGQRILDDVARHYSQRTIPVGRLDSYVQLCIYEAHHRRSGRRFLQEPHIDGHLLTFIANTSQGLALNSSDGMQAIYLERDQMLVMAGTLLDEVTDGAIPGMLHAVIPDTRAETRRSLIYFLNPPRSHGNIKTYRSGRDIDMLDIANAKHMAFGNPSLHPL